MDYHRLRHLVEAHSALRLLKADHLPMIAGFLHALFIKPNRRSIPYPELESTLGDYLHTLRRELGEESFPREAREYLESWCHPQSAFLRKYYPVTGDIPECDLTPATEKVLEWLRSFLDEKHFVGTESRLLILFQLLRDFAKQTEDDPALRIRELEREKERIDQEIAHIQNGQLKRLDATQIWERFFQIEETSRRLLADFRQAEENFRDLDRQSRERIATTEQNKGRLLDQIFSEQDAIWDSDQGRSFRAFWELLMSPVRQDELDELLRITLTREDVERLKPDPFLSGIKFALLDAGEKVHRSNGQLVEQLRRFLDDRVRLENRRIMDLIHSIEKQAIECKDHPPAHKCFMIVDDIRPELNLVMTRGLFIPPSRPKIEAGDLEVGLADMNVDALYNQFLIDERELLANIQKALQTRSQISLKDLIMEFPVTRGVAEVVTYLHLAAKSRRAMISDEKREVLEIQDPFRRLSVPAIIFTRSLS